MFGGRCDPGPFAVMSNIFPPEIVYNAGIFFPTSELVELFVIILLICLGETAVSSVKVPRYFSIASARIIMESSLMV
jgi:hypothetical protein